MNRVSSVMRTEIECCVPETRAPDLKYLVKKYDYHDIFVVDNMEEKHLLGVIHEESLSDDNLVFYVQPYNVKARDCMQPAVSITPESGTDECLKLMDEAHTDVLPVTDSEGHICGLVKKEDLIL